MPPAAHTIPRIEVRELHPQHVASVRMASDIQRVRRTIWVLHELVMQAVAEQGLAPAGPLFARYHRYGDQVDVEAGVPLAQPIEPAGIVGASSLPGGSSLHMLHIGDFESRLASREVLVAHGRANGYSRLGGPWECYLVDDRDTPDPRQWLTDIYLPVGLLPVRARP